MIPDTPTPPGAPRPTTPMPVAVLFQPTSAAFTVTCGPVKLPEAEFWRGQALDDR